MQSTIIPVYKPVGYTPLQILNLLKKNTPELETVPLAYAGRLDPMAEGLLLVLTGDECKKREKYQMLSKEYEVKVIFGFETDTYDPLGLVTNTCNVDIKKIDKISESLQKFVGKYDQTYPPYSSARVNGKPLFYWARENKLSEITRPSKQIEIRDIKVLDVGNIHASKLLKNIYQKISSVEGDFRQEDILENWSKLLENNDGKYPFVSLYIKSSHGAYMRSLAHDLGKSVGGCAIALSIKRVAVGKFKVDDALKL